MGSGGGGGNPFQGVSWNNPLGTQSQLSQSALGQGLSTANNNFSAGMGALGNNINQAHNSQNMNYNNLHNQQNNITNPGNWGSDVSQSAFMTGQGTPWGPGTPGNGKTDVYGVPGVDLPATTSMSTTYGGQGGTQPTAATPNAAGTPQAAPGNFSNGALPSYMNNSSEQNFLNSYAKSLNPNVNYNINAQNNPNQFSNPAVRGAGPVSAGGK